MAKRPVFIAKKNELGVQTEYIEFEWFSGMSIKQKQRSIHALHSEFYKKFSHYKVLEVSSKSEEKLGIELSAFNLKTKTVGNNFEFSVETAFQSSKIFEHGGPYRDLLEKTSREAKMDNRLRTSGKLISFNFFGKNIPTKPMTLFYDWLYINVLLKNDQYIHEILKYDSFTDIEFNFEKSINCQAYSAALFVSLVSNNISLERIREIEEYIKITNDVYKSNRYIQLDIL